MEITRETAPARGADGPSGLDAIFRPRSVAVLGVTNTPGTVPHDIFVNILHSGFNGVVYPVAPKKRHIAGVRAYDYVLDIPDPVDLAVLVFPGAVCEKALEQCVEKGVRAAVIISAGFRETGPAGLAREQRVKAIVEAAGMRMIGPNCLGVINTEPHVLLNASFARAMPAEGRIAFLSQSGALCTAVLDYAAGQNIGFSKFVSVGNKADVSDVDLLRYLADDPQTSVILMYLEEVTRGRELLEAARLITSSQTNPKPILAIKSGRTAAGAAAAASHTGALASADAACGAAFAQAGIIRCFSIEEMFNSATLLANQPLPRGPRLAIVTNAGGPGVLATDAAIERGLEIARFAPPTTEKLKAALPAAANIKNPVDVIGDARDDRYAAALDAVFADEGVDCVLTILTPQSMTNIESIAHTVCTFREQHAESGKTLACSFMGAKDVATGIAILQEHHIPHYILPEWACAAFRDAVQHARWRAVPLEAPKAFEVKRSAAAAILDAAPAGYLPEHEALQVLAAYGFPAPAAVLAHSADEAVAAAERLGYPAALRLVSRTIIHKSEVRGVLLNLKSADAVRQAWSAMRDAVLARHKPEEIEGFLVRPMIPAGREVILGVKRDPSFGPVLMCGLGGIYVEVLKDVAFRIAPVGASTAADMLRSLRAFALLAGARGEAPSDVAAVEECLVRLGQLACDFPRIAELDINPLIVHDKGRGAAVADIRMRLE